MSEDKQDKLFIKLKNYNKEREAILDKALEKSERGEKLTQSEIEVIREHFPNEEELKKMTEKMSGLSKAIEGIVQPQMEIVKTISDNIDEITKPITDSITSFGKGLQKALQPVFDELENQYKENPLTRKEIDKLTTFLNERFPNNDNKTLAESFYSSVSTGFKFEDCLISENQDDILLSMKKIKMDLSPIPCPACMTTIQSGNAFPELFLRSYECKNPNCPERSKSGRGKRFDEFGVYRYFKLTEDKTENEIQQYKNTVLSSPQDTSQFNELLDGILDKWN